MKYKRTFNGKKETGFTDWSRLDDQPLLGIQKRLKNMQKRLAIGFAQTEKEYLPNGMKTYARNRNSKGKLIPVLYTLTYPSNDEWHPQDITNFCRKITMYSERTWGFKLRYFWVAETTKTGVIHYHLVTWIPRSFNGKPARLPKASEPMIVNNRKYPPLWKYRAEVSGVRKGVYTYLSKYISKGCIVGGLDVSKRVQVNDSKRFKCLMPKTKIVKPRLFGYGGFKPNQREYMSHCMLPKYVKEHFWSVEYGDKVQRVKGGWQLNRANKVSKIYKYFKYGNDLLSTNFRLWADEINGYKVIGYDYGVNWSSIPEPSTDDIWIPF